MSVNLKMDNVLKVKSDLDKKLISEGLTENETKMLNEINRRLSEAPIDYEGPEGMEPGIERQITQKRTPYHEHPALPTDGDRDYIELISSQRFKDSVEKVRHFLGDTRPIQGNNAFMGLISSIMGSLPSFISINFSDLKSLSVLIKLSVAVPAIFAKSSLEMAIEKCSLFS